MNTSENKTTTLQKGPRSAAAKRLLSQIMKGKDTTLKQKVAHTLNHFSAARDSDITLTIRLLTTFYSDYIDEDNKISLSDLYELPKFYDMQRLRAQIQNDYGLFRASPEVEALRKDRKFASAEEFAESRPDYNSVFVFSDESGKDQNYLVFGSLWIYSPNEHISILKEIDAWRSKKRYSDEIHFRTIKNQEKASIAIEFFKTVIQSGSYIGFKCLLVDSKALNSSRLVDAVYEGITQLLVAGVKSEFKTRRIRPPLRISLSKDADPATDLLKLSDFNLRTVSAFQTIFADGSATLESVLNPQSEKNDLIQIADLFTASVGRWVNQGVPVSEDNPKELIARQIGDILSFRINKEGRITSKGDMCKIEYFLPDVQINRGRR